MFEGGFVPKGVFSGLLGSLIKRAWSIAYDHSHTPRLFRNKAVLKFDLEEYDYSIKCIIAASANFVEVSLENCDDERLLRVACPYTREVITKSMKDACSRLNYGKMWRLGAVCCHRTCNCINARQHFAQIDLSKKKLICQMTTEKYPLTTQDKVWFEGWYDFTIEGFNYY